MGKPDKNPVNQASKLPLLPLRDVVVYPYMVIPLFVGRVKSVAALDMALAINRSIVLATQKHPDSEELNQNSLFAVGVRARILQMLKLPDDTVKVLVEGIERVQISNIECAGGYYEGSIQTLVEFEQPSKKHDALMKSLWTQFEHYARLGRQVSVDVIGALSEMKDAKRIVDSIASHLSIKIEEKQKILEIQDVDQRIEYLLGLIEIEIDLLQVDKRIRGRVKKQMEKSQREYYLNEQMKAIQKELGGLDSGGNDLDQLQEKITKAKMPKDAEEKTLTELERLRHMSAMSAEAAVIRGYIDWMLSIPWKKSSKVQHNLKRAEQVLNEDHCGLEEVKDRILEYLAVQSRVKKMKGPVLCLVGPPGVGKTSLGESIARATNRKFVRMALGGVHDEAEIRGHRRTYIGSMPGKLLQKMAKVGVRNPLFLLDEIDKMGSDMRGDPAAALLEVLDPEQNHSFNDNYLEVDYDLSDVMFVCTSNSMNIHPALMDRMEVIRIPGYTEDEKMNISQTHLLPKQLKCNGLKKGEVNLDEGAILDIIRYYTREAGVRNLERSIAKVCRKVVKKLNLKEETHSLITSENLEKYLGVRKFKYGLAGEKDQVGQVTGLAWTEVGGELLTIESMITEGKGKIIKTGSLGEVMQESIQAAMTVVSARKDVLGIDINFLEKKDIHIHVPEGATPKDGPSAGIAMCTALVSALTEIPIRADVAMTGEITLRGQVLGIGGLKEKLLAAHRGGIKIVLIPEENAHDLKEVPENLIKDMDIRLVKWIDEVFEVALQFMPKPKRLSDAGSANLKENNVANKEIIMSTH